MPKSTVNRSPGARDSRGAPRRRPKVAEVPPDCCRIWVPAPADRQGHAYFCTLTPPQVFARDNERARVLAVAR